MVVRPWEAVTRIAAPFLSPNPHHIQPSRENTKRGHDLLDNALAFRMPGSFAGRPRPSSPPGRQRHSGDTDSGGSVGKGGGIGQALRAIDGNSPPRSISPSSPARRRGRGGSGGGNKRGRAAQRGRLGAVKLEATPPKSKSGCDSGRDLPPSMIALEEPVARVAGPSADSVSLSSHASLQEGAEAPPCVVGSGFIRRMSLSTSPPRRGLAGAFARVFPFGGGAGDPRVEEKDQGLPCRAVVHPRQVAAEAAAVAAEGPAGTAPRRRSAAVTEGSRIDLRGLERARGGNQPRAFRCRDSSVVVLGRERMLSVLPDDKDGSSSSSGVVTWVLRYTELESCCINVSAGKDVESSVGDVVVEVTTR